jgi:hypothetical protein
MFLTTVLGNGYSRIKIYGTSKLPACLDLILKDVHSIKGLDQTPNSWLFAAFVVCYPPHGFVCVLVLFTFPFYFHLFKIIVAHQ